MKHTVTVLLLFLLLLGCKEEFLLKSNNYNKSLVVDGIITNESGPYTIKLYFSSPASSPGKVPCENCNITLFENNSKSETLTETNPGVYKTSEDGIKASIGNVYYILIETPSGNIYKSEPQEMKFPVEIDTVYAKLEYKEDLNYVYGLPGYQFYINTKLAPYNNTYLLWTLIETYQYSNDFRLEYLFDGEEWLYMNLGQLPEYENLYRCWKTQNAGYIFTGNTSNLSIPKISNQPLNFVGTNTKKLQERYSLNVIQYSIDENAYSFWESIEEQTSQDNFLISNQPYNIIGNVKNTNTPDETVYGYFTVASVSKKRIFIDRPNTPFYYKKCAVMEDAPEPVPDFYVTDENGKTGQVLESCIDCRFNGGEPSKPNFWIDK
ncbi:MAG: DUF4249 domain-containing protein [Bacteroidetes bacterium]|nr:DUF4249 domain-containing protein [Bacteroidota bacterium]